MEKHLLKCRKYLILLSLLFLGSQSLFSQQSLSEDLTFEIQRLEILQNSYIQQAQNLKMLEQSLQTANQSLQECESNLSQITESYQILYKDYTSLEMVCKRWKIAALTTTITCSVMIVPLTIMLVRSK